MVYKRYYSPFEEKRKPEIIHPKREEDAGEACGKPCEKPCPPKTCGNGVLGFLDHIGCDDMILIGLLVILLMEDKDKRDVPLILTLGFLFLIQYIEAD